MSELVMLAGAVRMAEQERMPAPCRLVVSSRGNCELTLPGDCGFTPLDAFMNSADRGDYRWQNS